MTQRINHEDEVLQYADWLEDNGHYAKSQRLRKRYALKQFPSNWSGTTTRTGITTWTRTRDRTRTGTTTTTGITTWTRTRDRTRTGTTTWTRTRRTWTKSRTRTWTLADGTRTP